MASSSLPSIAVSAAPDVLDTPRSEAPVVAPGKTLSLEGLRGLAAFTVVLSHFFYAFFPYLQTGDEALRKGAWESLAFHSPLRVLYNGNFSVAVFFVMSGYVLTRKFFKDPDVGSLQEAAVKRYVRLMPPVLVSVLLCYALMKLSLFPVARTDLGDFLGNAYQHSPSLVDALKEGLYRALLVGDSSYNYILWTLRAEFLGSLVLFAFLALFGRFRHSGWMAVLASVALLLIHPSDGLFYSLFLAGAYMHRWPDLGARPVLLVLALLGGLYLGGYHWYSEPYLWMVRLAHACEAQGLRLEWPVAFPALGAVPVVWAIVRTNPVSRALSSRPLVWLGDKSFSMYLLHSVLLSSVGVYVYLTLPATLAYSTRAVLAMLTVTLTTFLASALFARFVDMPTIRLSTWLGKALRDTEGRRPS
ncbi:Peptidoglycan/LPS O-acetylase OafA/YrhL, contains acyltransferase and SGNH-hydrolase domains [Myxococcus fulvus]|uniref:Acyltransferase n=1 Tax=Myxococcus fulvus TaxID=33 RepID=A0A511T838_MYXFU|nr:acyltransferase [Myxococcus fulvus]GEN10336.1 acyltransferase [Myxococcus fulvus]SEU34479.1 Peptidoglycan/LPS O-acetylase OafA/YrhL, contains acyltransferase and SGNH-hydrolase domains [Myxococcus fulvus]